jgi:ubiquinone/menaquinone biosynthesis C-methylase UbiE
MGEQHSKWQTSELTKAYLDGVRGAIPGAKLQLEVLSKIISIWRPRPSVILDLGCGDGILGRMLLDEHPAVHLIFADFSAPMLEELQKQIKSNERATIVRTDFSALDWSKRVATENSIDVVVSGFAIHHQPDRRKMDLYSEIYNLLKEGGVFLNLEHVSSVTPAGQTLFDSFFIDNLLQFHMNSDSTRTRQEIEETYYHRPDKAENILAPVETQCQWLRQIGFKDVDCFFKIFELALFGGRKA